MSPYTPNKPRPFKNSNINIQHNLSEQEGYYAGSASNMSRLIILVAFLFSLIFITGSFIIGKELGELNSRVSVLENGK